MEESLSKTIKENFLDSLAKTYGNKILDYFTLDSFLRLYDEWDIQNSHMYIESKLGEFQQETDGLEYIKTHKLVSGEYWFDSIDVVKHKVHGEEFDTSREASKRLYSIHDYDRDAVQEKVIKKVFILLKKLSDERKKQLGLKNYTLKEQLSIIEQKPIFDTYVKEIPNCVKRKFMEVLYDNINKDLNYTIEFEFKDFKQLYLKLGIQNIKMFLESKVGEVHTYEQLYDFIDENNLDEDNCFDTRMILTKFGVYDKKEGFYLTYDVSNSCLCELFDTELEAQQYLKKIDSPARELYVRKVGANMSVIFKKLDDEKKEELGFREFSIEEMIEIIKKYPIDRSFKYYYKK
ncbi:hypothetical protein CP965_00880 [Halarcobacter mediterraneus]|uniref:Uncharacterized protein n=1 Tax=Halarcobacter mediterraneus TaxID=2023153 RepID=A0A4Q1AVG8_9BACT|nr:hypothetical protein [Halarcobacter mediterraneus]RXK14035.1 hypothetical protein CP965_00880 [Halarcobacter mediterraneus]